MAYGDDLNRFIHYLHYHGHTYHIGDMAPSSSEANYLQDYEQFVRESSINEPGPLPPQSLTWQVDPSTRNTNHLYLITLESLALVYGGIFISLA